MAAAFNMTFYLFCLWSCIQVCAAFYCDYNDGTTSSRSKYCPYGCCLTGSDATYFDVCCTTSYNSNIGIIIIVSVVAAVVIIVVAIVIIVCCCCRRKTAHDRDVTTPNTTVVSNTVETSKMQLEVGYPPPNDFNLQSYHLQEDNTSLSSTEYSDRPPSCDTVTSPGQNNKGFETVV
ncbi:hypothetical protein SNE40_015724 [Patella caerulea]|uniref:Uncharacterized protein n=1 Tax=Patella caerulea TaxID=87958 RepID=A0AAN8JL99_PATCE